ncbi:Transposase family tnp2, partial [Rhizoctonia solani]
MPPHQRAAPRPPKPKRVCPHCNLPRSERQIRQHLEPYQEGRGYMSDSESELDLGNTSSSDDADKEPDHPHVLGQDKVPPNVPGDIDLGPPAHADLDPLANNNLHNMPPPLEHVQILDNLWRILCNPHAMLDQWGNYVEPNASEADNRSIREGSVSSNKDPAFKERMDEPKLDPNNPNNKPYINIDVLRNFLNKHLAELDNDKWEELHEYKQRTIIPGAAFASLPVLIPKPTIAASTCAQVFHYTPLIPQLRALYQDAAMAAKLRYQDEADQGPEPGVIHNVFDGQDYWRLRATPVNPPGGYHFFDNPKDLALGLSTDGVTLFKRRRRGLSTAWPIILINYNLHPRYQTKLDNIICVGVIPGPTQCKDINSFLTPLLNELLELEAGVDCHGLSPKGVAYVFLLHAFLIIVFGDILAVSKMICMKGHNGRTPCQACYMQGYPCPLARTTVCYIPLQRPNYPIPHSPFELPMQSHAEFLGDLEVIEAAPTRVAREFLQKDLGINLRSIFASLKSIDLSSSFPYDIMHLLFENLVPNMIKHWTGDFKWLDQGNGSYKIDEVVWKAVGRQTAAATKTIPAKFVGTIPNIAEDAKLFKAKAYAFWFQYMAPILLQGRLNKPYYSHFLKMQEIMLLVLKFGISNDEIDKLERMTGKWVLKYESYINIAFANTS